MTSARRWVIGGLAILVVLAVSYVAGFGLFPRFYDIAWDEDVLLHDGRVAVVRIARPLERTGLRMERYPLHPRSLGMSFSFDIGHGTFRHRFVRGTLHFLHAKDGKWHIGCLADPGDLSVEIGNRYLHPHIAVLNPNATIHKPANWADVPHECVTANILPATPDAKSIAAFDGKHLTVAEWLTGPATLRARAGDASNASHRDHAHKERRNDRTC
jgi:hypothetical protein